jgi:Cu/Ag efflux protein CusF
MSMLKILLVLSAFLFLQACGSPAANNSVSKAVNTPAPTPVPTSITPKDGDYPAKGVVTQVNMEAGWVEIDHEDIKDLMPPMKMMFNVTDTSILKGISAGDKVDFILEYRHPTEVVKSIKKSS